MAHPWCWHQFYANRNAQFEVQGRKKLYSVATVLRVIQQSCENSVALEQLNNVTAQS